jgi:hypothetical protein
MKNLEENARGKGAIHHQLTYNPNGDQTTATIDFE